MDPIFGQIFVENIKVPGDLYRGEFTEDERDNDTDCEEELPVHTENVEDYASEREDHDEDDSTKTKKQFIYKLNTQGDMGILNKDRRQRFISVSVSITI